MTNSKAPKMNSYQILYERMFESLLDIHEAGGMDRAHARKYMKVVYKEFGITEENPNTERVIGLLFIGIINAANRRTRNTYWGNPLAAYETAEKVLADIGKWYGIDGPFQKKTIPQRRSKS